MSETRDKQRVEVELKNGIRIIGDTIEMDAFGVQVFRLREPFGDRIPYRAVRTTNYFRVQ